jgi:hypothetical protein
VVFLLTHNEQGQCYLTEGNEEQTRDNTSLSQWSKRSEKKQ